MWVRRLVARVVHSGPPHEPAVVELTRRRLVQPAAGPSELVSRRLQRGVRVDPAGATPACARHEAVLVVLSEPPHARRRRFLAAIRHQQAGGEGLGGEDAFPAGRRRPEVKPRPDVRACRSIQHGRSQPKPVWRPATACARGSRHEGGRHARQRCCAKLTDKNRRNSTRLTLGAHLGAVVSVCLMRSIKWFGGSQRAAATSPRAFQTSWRQRPTGRGQTRRGAREDTDVLPCSGPCTRCGAATRTPAAQAVLRQQRTRA